MSSNAAPDTANDRQNAPRRGVLFDIDGTLCDTNYIHAVCWARALREVEDVVVPMSTIHHHIGMGSDKFTTEVIGRHSEEAGDAHSKYYRDFWDEVRAFDGAGELLMELRDRGLDVVLASSSEGDEFEMLQDVIGAKEAITAATSSDDVKASKPAPDIFGVALKKAGLQPQDAMVVGDTIWDVQAARAAGLECIGVLSGGISRAELTDAGAVEVYEDVRTLLDNLDDSALGRLWNAE